MFLPVDRYQTQVLVRPDASEMCVIKTLAWTTTWRGAHLLQSTTFRKLRKQRGTIAWLQILPLRRRVPGSPHVARIATAARHRPKALHAAASPAAAVAAKPVAAVLAPAGVAVLAAAALVLSKRTVVSGSAGVPTRPETPATGLMCAA